MANAHTFFVGKEGVLVHNDVHHICSNKHKFWSDKFRDLFDKAGLGKFKNGNKRKDILNDPQNKIKVDGHKGPHAEQMHQQTFDRLQNALDKGGG